MNTRFDEGNAGGGPRWMLVDDNEDILRLTRFIINRSYEIDIECYREPAAALAAFQAAPESIGLVITDLDMPGMNGVELCDRVHSISPETKIILITGNELVTEEDSTRRGFCGLLRKPFQNGALEQTLDATGIGAKFHKKFPQRRALTTA